MATTETFKESLDNIVATMINDVGMRPKKILMNRKSFKRLSEKENVRKLCKRRGIKVVISKDMPDDTTYSKP